MLGDEYISQHISQAHRDYAEQTSYRVYMSNMVTEIISMKGYQVEKRWSELLQDLDSSDTTEKQTETEQEIKSRMLAKLNGREGA